MQFVPTSWPRLFTVLGAGLIPLLVLFTSYFEGSGDSPRRFLDDSANSYSTGVATLMLVLLLISSYLLGAILAAIVNVFPNRSFSGFTDADRISFFGQKNNALLQSKMEEVDRSSFTLRVASESCFLAILLSIFYFDFTAWEITKLLFGAFCLVTLLNVLARFQYSTLDRLMLSEVNQNERL